MIQAFENVLTTSVVDAIPRAAAPVPSETRPMLRGAKGGRSDTTPLSKFMTVIGMDDAEADQPAAAPTSLVEGKKMDKKAKNDEDVQTVQNKMETLNLDSPVKHPDAAQYLFEHNSDDFLSPKDEDFQEVQDKKENLNLDSSQQQIMELQQPAEAVQEVGEQLSNMQIDDKEIQPSGTMMMINIKPPHFMSDDPMHWISKDDQLAQQEKEQQRKRRIEKEKEQKRKGQELNNKSIVISKVDSNPKRPTLLQLIKKNQEQINGKQGLPRREEGASSAVKKTLF